MLDLLVKVEGVSKKFCKNLKRSMLYGLQDIAKNMIGVPLKSDNLRSAEFWSVDNVSFEIRRGECLGLIGPNGAGKSTLLKILNGIISPDKGRVEIRGKVSALIEVGAGFHPMLTGRENIYINGSILGFTKKEIDKKFDEIVEFAELGDFIDTPVKHYSSGMYVRLGFAIAAQMEPDVMLIDEVLAVGDVGFRAKCFNAIDRISKDAAVIFVSHQMPQISRICTDICVMSHGKAEYSGKEVPKGIGHYYSNFETVKGIVTGSGRATIHKIDFESNGKKGIRQINYMDDLSVYLNISVDPNVKHPVVGITFLSQELHMIAQCISSYNSVELSNFGEPLHITLKLPALNLNPGVYLLSALVFCANQQEILAQYFAVKELHVLGKFIGSAPVQLLGKWNVKHEVQEKKLNRSPKAVYVEG